MLSLLLRNFGKVEFISIGIDKTVIWEFENINNNKEQA